MIEFADLLDPSRGELVPTSETDQPAAWRYSCELNPRHVDAVALPRIAARYPQENYDRWFTNLAHTEDQIGYIASWIKETIHQMPGGIDVARDVDDGGFTEDRVRSTLFTPWVMLQDGTHARFSESRTAMHNKMHTTKGLDVGGALRSPVMGGVVLEVTSNPASTDPRNMVSLAIFEFARPEDARYPWLRPRSGRLFDMTQFTDEPYSVGPLFSGHPNEMTDPEAVSKALEAAALTLRLTVESNLANA